MKIFNGIFLLAIFLISFCQLGKSQICSPIGTDTPSDEMPGCQLMANTFSGSTEGFTDLGALPDRFIQCSSLDKRQFFYFVADSTGSFSGDFSVSNCTENMGAQIFIFNHEFWPISNCLSVTSGSGWLVADRLRPGEVYFIAVDGFEDEICDFTLTVDNGIALSKVDPNDPTNIPNLTSNLSSFPFCPDSTVCFSTKSIPDADGYIWTLPDTASIISGGTFADTFVCLNFFWTTNSIIGITPVFGSGYGPAATFHAPVINRVEKIDTAVCLGESIEIGGETFDAVGRYEIFLTDINDMGCDSLIKLNFQTPDTTPLHLSCVIDTFINSIGFNWPRKPLADGYEVWLNDSLMGFQANAGLLLTAPYNGQTYHLRVKPYATHGCSYTWSELTCQAPNTSSLSHISEKRKVQVFPIPSKSYVEVFSEEDILKIDLFNLSGMKLKSSFENRVDLEEFESGIYFLRIHFEDGVVVRKVLKG